MCLISGEFTCSRFTGVTKPTNPHFLTIAKALIVENDNVYNCLVNHKGFQRKVPNDCHISCDIFPHLEHVSLR